MSTQKILTDWIVIYPMDSFLQLLNNHVRCIAKGCSKLVNTILTITVCGGRKAKKIDDNRIIFTIFLY